MQRSLSITAEKLTMKLERDFAKDVDAAIAESNDLCAQGSTEKAFELLGSIEKQTRVGADAISNGRLLVQIVSLAFLAGNLKLVNEFITIYAKKHGLLKLAVTRMVQEAVLYVERIPDAIKRLELIDTLRTVTDGKIYVEVEHARVTRMLAAIKEAEGKTVEACDILQELQVETFGSMERREKTDFILEQMRLCLAKGDYVRMQIVSRKVSAKYFESAETQDLKLRYHAMLVQHALQEDNYLACCKHYKHIYDTPCIKEDAAKRHEALQNVVVFICLSAHDNEQSDFINRLCLDANLSSLPIFKQLVKAFTTPELMRWPRIEEIYGPALKPLAAFDVATEGGAKRWKALHSRVVEHKNIRVVSKYYKKITTARLRTLLDLSSNETEEFLSRLVVSKTIFARIHRPKGIISFESPKNAEVVLNEWSGDVNSLLAIIDKTNHLIDKEEMVHAISK